MKFKIKKGDLVKVIAGEDKGRAGKILSIDKQNQRAFVEGLNTVSRHTKPNAKSPQGGIIKKEASIHISNLMLVDSKGTASRVGMKRDENGKVVRYLKKSQVEIK